MASQSAPPCIVWFRDDLRLSDHPALHAAASSGRPVICLYVLDEPGRTSGARPLGGAARWWLAQSLRALQKRPRSGWLRAGAAQGAGSKDHRRDWRARPVPAPCSGTRSRRHRNRPPPIRSPRRSRRSASPRKAFPAIFSRTQPHPHQGRPRLAGVHAVLAARAGTGRSAETAAGARNAAPGARALRATASKAGISSQRGRIGPAACARAGRPANWRRSSGLEHFLQTRRRLCQRARPARSRRHLPALAASALWRVQPASGLARRPLCRGRTPCPVRRYRQIPQRTRLARILPPSAVRCARSRRCATCSPPSTPFHGEHDDKALARLAARPDRLSHRRCRHARALAHRRHAQPGANGGGVVPGQASPDRLARGRKAGSGTRWSMPTPAAIPPTGNGSPAPAPTPRPISASSIRSCRARNSIPTAPMSGAGCRNSRDCRQT